jgi:hypothetical protein
LSLYQPKEAVGSDSLFRTTSSGIQHAPCASDQEEYHEN